jgi:AmmeMemoRadiSam system protein A
MTDAMAKSYHLNLELDHGALVPLYYLNKAGFRGQIVILGVGIISYEEMYTFGKAVQVAIEAVNKKTAVIASGDLSHRLLPGAPYGYSPLGAEFDKRMMEAMKKVDAKDLFSMETSFIENAGECGLRPAFFLLGVMGGLEAKVGVTSYEGPFGVGYGVVSYAITGKKQCRENLSSNPAALAKASLKYYLENGKKMSEPKELAPLLAKRAGVFVSLKKNGQLRGCIGTFLPQEPTVAREIIKNAVSAGLYDPRFAPVEISELAELTVSVDILSEPEQVNSTDALDDKKYGVIVRHENKTGLLLPNLEGIDTVMEQIHIAMQKAGISPNEEIDLYRFTVERHT